MEKIKLEKKEILDFIESEFKKPNQEHESIITKLGEFMLSKNLIENMFKDKDSVECTEAEFAGSYLEALDMEIDSMAKHENFTDDIKGNMIMMGILTMAKITTKFFGKRK